MNISDIRTKTLTELSELLSKTRKELHDLKINVLQNKEKNVKKPQVLKRDIAKIQTVITEKKYLEGVKNA